MDFKKEVEGSNKRIILCEKDERVIKAARILADERVVSPVLVGDADNFKRLATAQNISLQGIELVSIIPETYSALYTRLRAHKNITVDQALGALAHPARYSCMLLQDGKADGLVCGASWPTADTIRPALEILRKGLASSYFLMKTPRGDMLFGDCAFNIQPDAEQLARIAHNTGLAAEQLGMTPRIAMLSFSTAGSAEHPDQKKVVEATWKLRELAQDTHWIIGGEVQVDAALNPQVAVKKNPNSQLRGGANVFIFPDLDAGNIGYKLVQRFTGCEAIGPIMTGFTKPVNDLSRGCTVQEIVDLCYLTAWQSTQQN